ncbi:TetR/AcrR family transcriptional regulator [Citricoccus sp. GCM10030269]|uniref:TetR/AcrR family transcriptional regulator n=1 Tax=Citricoccus sp. GCM10030269 TaxID=3273388 RepID=UPI00360A3449
MSSSAPSPDQGSLLSRDRIRSHALELADTRGLTALTIRTLAASLGTKPMSVYHYVSGKEQILDWIVDAVFAEISDPTPNQPWRPALSARYHSARQTLLRHPWAVPLMESRRSPGPSTLRHHEATLEVLRSSGFSVPQAAHAYALLDAYLYGSVLQESALPLNDGGGIGEEMAAVADAFSPEQLPRLREMATEHILRPGYDFGEEFGFGLELILDGLERLLQSVQTF